MLTVLRLLEIPARYVSGHLPDERAPHAWVEALVRDATMERGVRVVGYDPTNHRQPGPDYVVVAVGRDFADVTPTSGWFSGAARSELAAAQSVRVIQADRVPEPDAAS
jgi:transglutaminase-like putative cysteine protease